ncbi:hypothetical protein B4U80_13549 [Leptotrombidium deliense]|uniref:Caspase family p20 domain-containing protein n=1 Tax=Leptotrombidium deliense TaxID=299467 RepID=A0A443S4L8_9ACAR|nr:hypothetical protein B4U80_13549 [Leptotrombidium deliense]
MLPSSIGTLHIHFHGHGYYCTEKRENYVIGTNEEKIYFRQLFELFPKTRVIKCLYLDLCNFEWNHEGKTNEFYIMDTQQPSEMFFKRTDIFVHYVKPFNSGAVYCELFEIKNRFHKDGKEGIWVQFAANPEVSNTFADYLSTEVRKTYRYHFQSTKMDEYIDKHLDEINDDEIFILQLDLDAVKVDGSFMLNFGNKPFYLTTFFQTLMKNHPRLRYLPKMIFLNISVLDPCCGYIEYINLFATEKENSEITKNENKNYTTNSEMFIIWSTVSGFANLNGFHIGSCFSYLVREILRQSLSTKIGFTYLLSKESIYPIEINNVNAHKIIVFGNIESENAYDVKNGLCVIIENKCFPENMKPNYLSHITADNFEEAFECHNFEVRRDLHDAPAALMCDYLKKIAADSKLNRYTALVIIIISKSETILNANVIYGSDNQYISMNNLKMLFSDENCKALKGKLKLFIIDGPRGDSIPDYRNKDDVEIYSNVSQLFDKDISCAKNMPDNINFTIDTPMGHMNLGNTIIVGVSRERVQIKAMPQNNRHRFNIFKGETCIATLDDLSEYDFGYTYWEKTNASIVDSSVGKILFSRRRNNSKIPDRSKFKSAKCFCEI